MWENLCCSRLCNCTSRIQGCQKCTLFLWGQKWHYLWHEPLCLILLKPFCTVSTLLLRSSTFNNFQHLHSSSIFCIFLSIGRCCAKFSPCFAAFSVAFTCIFSKKCKFSSSFSLSFLLLFLTCFYLLLCQLPSYPNSLIFRLLLLLLAFAGSL